MTLRVDVLTIFPDAVRDYCATSVLGRAAAAGVWDLRVLDLRDATSDVHRSVGRRALRGGPGMVMSVEPIVATVEATPTWRAP